MVTDKQLGGFMAKSSGVSEGEIREGFICPICLCDLKAVDQLQDHFEVAHSSEDHDVFQALKGFIDKAKRKILKQDTWNEDLSKVEYEPETLYNIPCESPQWPMQDIGLTTSHIQYFKRLRDKKINRYVLETNKLLIRLNKLICDIADDPEKRKDFEKSVVPWVPDSDVPLCPGCAKSFGLSRRRHHCRLCGGVMCQSCSFFLNNDFARKLTVSVVSDDQRLLPKSNHVSRRPSSASLMSVVNLGGEHLIRICKDCHVLLERHDKLTEQKHHKPVVVQMYERVKDCKDEIEKLVPVYLEMLHSLNSGETDYQLQDARDLHIKISKLAERVDAQSKRILKLEVSPEENNTHTVQLHSGIRMAASQFLRNVVLGLPAPPSQEEIAHYQNIRQEQMQRRIELEKLSKKKETSKSPSPVATPKTPKPTASDPVSPDRGWCVTTDKVQEDGDPMLQQIKIINNYIQQARMDKKYDEVRMLENNLQELLLEYKRQKKSS